MTILDELSTIADKLHGCQSVAIRRDGKLDILKSEHVEMLVIALRAFTGQAQDYSATNPEDMGPDRGE